MIVRRQVHMPSDVFPLELHVHRPGGEVDLAPVYASDDPLLGRGSGFIPRGFLEVGCVFEHDLLTGDLDALAAPGRVLGESGIRVGYRPTWRCCRILRRCHAHIGKGADGFPIRLFAGYLSPIGKDIIGHRFALWSLVVYRALFSTLFPLGTASGKFEGGAQEREGA